MSSLNELTTRIHEEIAMSDACLVNLLSRLDEDIARIQDRKAQLIDEFDARRNALLKLIGGSDTAETTETQTPAQEISDAA